MEGVGYLVPRFPTTFVFRLLPFAFLLLSFVFFLFNFNVIKRLKVRQKRCICVYHYMLDRNALVTDGAKAC